MVRVGLKGDMVLQKRFGSNLLMVVGLICFEVDLDSTRSESAQVDVRSDPKCKKNVEVGYNRRGQCDHNEIGGRGRQRHHQG